MGAMALVAYGGAKAPSVVSIRRFIFLVAADGVSVYLQPKILEGNEPRTGTLEPPGHTDNAPIDPDNSLKSSSTTSQASLDIAQDLDRSLPRDADLSNVVHDSFTTNVMELNQGLADSLDSPDQEIRDPIIGTEEIKRSGMSGSNSLGYGSDDTASATGEIGHLHRAALKL